MSCCSWCGFSSFSRLPHSSYSAHHSVAPSVLTSASGAVYRWISRRRVHQVHLVLYLLHRQAARCQPTAAFPHSPGQRVSLSAGRASAPAPAEHHYRRLHLRTAGIRRAAALVSPAHRWQFNSDEWRDSPAINRLDAGSVVSVLWSAGACPAVQVTSGFRDSDIQPVRSHSRRHPFATLRPSGCKIATFDQRLCMCPACSAPAVPAVVMVPVSRSSSVRIAFQDESVFSVNLP